MTDSSTEKSFFENLWSRRFFQFLATYIAASWGAIQVLEWAVNRYDVPSVWVDKLVILLLVLLPTVIGLIYFHGKPGDDKWYKFEKVFYPMNVVVALVMSLFVIRGNAGEVTEKITITTVDGLTEVREVPKKEFNKKVVIFPIDEFGKEPSWRGVAIGELVDKELEQDMKVVGVGPLSLSGEYEDYGYKNFSKIPFATKLNLAEDKHSNYFIEGEFIDNAQDQINVKIYRTNDGSVVREEVVSGEEIFSISEKLSEIINKEIKLSQVEGKEKYIDLPSSNLISSDTSALRSYIEANMTIINNPKDTESTLKQVEESVIKDPACAECWKLKANMALLSGKDGRGDMVNALKYVDNLPERQQLDLKFFNYLLNNDMDKAEKLAKMWVKLYPMDMKPYYKQIGLMEQVLRHKDAKEVAKLAMDNGHKGSIYLTSARLAVVTREWDEAEEYLNMYLEAYPKKNEATSLLIDVYSGKGDSENAMELLDEMMLMDPNDKSLYLKKAKLESKENKFDQAISTLTNSLARTDQAKDSLKNYMEQLTVYSRAMKYADYATVRAKMKEVYMNNFPPIGYLQTEYATVAYHKDIGEVDMIKMELDALVELLPPQQRMISGGLNNFIVALFTEDTTRVRELYERVKPIFSVVGNESILKIYESEIAYIYGEYDKAIEIFGEYFVEMASNTDMVSMDYPESFLKKQDYKGGLELINSFLKIDSYHPIFNLYKVEFLVGLNRKEEAKKVLSEILPIFEASDSRYKYTKRAKKLAENLDV